MTEQLPFVIRPITYDIPEKDQKGYSRREEREIGGVKYLFYYMDDDKAFTDYMETLSKIGKVEDFEITQVQRFSFGRGGMSTDFFKCKCRVCTNPPEFEAFYIAKDYKVVEGVRRVKCLGILGNLGPSEHWLAKQLANPPSTRRDYFHEWTMPPESLDAVLEQVRHKGESCPSPHLTHVYTVNPDE